MKRQMIVRSSEPGKKIGNEYTIDLATTTIGWYLNLIKRFNDSGLELNTIEFKGVVR